MKEKDINYKCIRCGKLIKKDERIKLQNKKNLYNQKIAHLSKGCKRFLLEGIEK
jgi:hypothetical protein